MSKNDLLKRLTFTVNEDGTTTMDLSGFQGASCLAASKTFQEELAAFGVQVDITQFFAKPELRAALTTGAAMTQGTEAVLHDGGQEEA